MRNKVVITGANGFVGQKLCEKMAPYFSIIAGVRAQSPGPYATWAYGDITQPMTPPKEHGVTTLIHAAARVHCLNDRSENRMKAYRAVNVQGLKHTIEALLPSGLKRIIFLSTIKVLGEQSHRALLENDPYNPLDDYARSKMEAEIALKGWANQLGLEYVIVRPPLVYGTQASGNIKRILQVARKGIPLPFLSIRNQRSMVSLDRLCDFLMHCLKPQAANQTYHICDPKDYSTPEFLKLLMSKEGATPRLMPCPVWALKGLGLLTGKAQEIQRLCGTLQINSQKAQDLLQSPMRGNQMSGSFNLR